MQRQRLGVLILAATALAVAAASHRVGQADTVRAGSCDNDTNTDHCQKNGSPPPCPSTSSCTDYYRWFNTGVPCSGIPDASVGSFNFALRDVYYWTDCYSGFVPGSSCDRSWADCGTVVLYASPDCSRGTLCGQYTMQGCIGTSPATCY